MNKQENLVKIIKNMHIPVGWKLILFQKSVFNLNHTSNPIKVRGLIFSGIKISIFKLWPVSDHRIIYQDPQ